MTPRDADLIIETLVAGYPRQTLGDATTVTWAEAIQESGADPARATEIARRWPRTHEWFPSLAEFLAIITPRNYAEPEYVDPDEMRPAPAVARKLNLAWRKALADMPRTTTGRGADGHWHGGPQPCPVCGGIAPGVGR